MREMAREKVFDESRTPAGSEYQRARGIWLDDLGQARAQARTYLRLAVGAMMIAALAVVGLIVLSARSDIEPYLIEVDALGQVRQVGVVTTKAWEVEESMMRAELERWVRNLRSISTDKGVVEQRFTYVQTHVLDAAALQLERYVRDHDPFARFGRQSRTVHIEAINQVQGSDLTWRVQWYENITGPKGSDLGQEHFIGEFHLAVRRPETEAALRDNPLGIFVAFFSIDARSKHP